MFPNRTHPRVAESSPKFEEHHYYMYFSEKFVTKEKMVIMNEEQKSASSPTSYLVHGSAGSLQVL